MKISGGQHLDGWYLSLLKHQIGQKLKGRGGGWVTDFKVFYGGNMEEAEILGEGAISIWLIIYLLLLESNEYINFCIIFLWLICKSCHFTSQLIDKIHTQLKKFMIFSGTDGLILIFFSSNQPTNFVVFSSGRLTKFFPLPPPRPS